MESSVLSLIDTLYIHQQLIEQKSLEGEHLRTKSNIHRKIAESGKKRNGEIIPLKSHEEQTQIQDTFQGLKII